MIAARSPINRLYTREASAQPAVGGAASICNHWKLPCLM